MSVSRAQAPDTKAASVVAALPVIRRELARYASDPVVLDDLTQEVLVRLLGAADRLDPSTTPVYARVVAHNVVRSRQRDERNRRRKSVRAAATGVWEAPGADEEADLDGAEAAAVQAVLDRLSPSDRKLLERRVAEDGDGEAADEPWAGSARVRLLRARARARVRYVLALRGLQPASDRCLPVLDALAAGDRARQRSTGVQHHVAGCTTCAAVAEDVTRRQRPLPVLMLLGGSAALWRAMRQHPAVSAGGATAAVALGVVAAAAAGGGGGNPAPPPVVAVPAPAPTDAARPVSATSALAAPATTGVVPAVSAPAGPTPAEAPLATADRVLLPLPPDLAALVGAEVAGRDVTVRSVVGDEAFWVGSSDVDQLLVVLVGGGESSQAVEVGHRVRFTGRMIANTGETAGSAGVEPSEHLDLLARQGVHLEVPAGALVLQ